MSSLSTPEEGLSLWATLWISWPAELSWAGGSINVSVPWRPGETGWTLAAVRVRVVYVGYAIRDDRDGVVGEH